MCICRVTSACRELIGWHLSKLEDIWIASADKLLGPPRRTTWYLAFTYLSRYAHLPKFLITYTQLQNWATCGLCTQLPWVTLRYLHGLDWRPSDSYMIRSKNTAWFLMVHATFLSGYWVDMTRRTYQQPTKHLYQLSFWSYVCHEPRESDSVIMAGFNYKYTWVILLIVA